MKTTPLTLLSSMIGLGLSVACSDLATSVDPSTSAGGAHSNGGHSSRAGAAGNEAGSAGAVSAGASSNGGSPDGGAANGGAANGGAANGGAANGGAANGGAGNGGSGGASTAALTSVDAHVSGRDGSAILFTVKGTKPAAGINSLAVTFEDASGTAIKFFDSDWDGVPDATGGRVVFDTAVSGDPFTVTATLSGVKDASKLIKAKVALLDGNDQSSSELEISIGAQTVVHLGDACDPTLSKNRCDSGQACAGTPSKCAAGVAPVIAELKYLHASGGPLILSRGSDPDDDMGTMHIELLDSSNQPVTVDENSSPTTTIDTLPANLSTQGSFFSFVKATPSLDTLVSRVRVTPVDAAGNQGTPVTADIANVTQAADGGSCDARGFIGCVTGDVCSPGLPTTAGKCTKALTARTTQCTTAIKLDPVAGPSSTTGRIEGISLWDPPAGCTNPENVDRPEGVVSLHLASSVKTLTVSTRRPETTIDTVLYVLPGCADDSSSALGCNDDDLAGGYASGLTLSDVPAGDYTIIVESGQLAGGVFGVAVSTQ